MATTILRSKEAAAYLGLSYSTITKLRVYGGGPSYLKLTPRAVGYRVEDLDAWLASRPVQTTTTP